MKRFTILVASMLGGLSLMGSLGSVAQGESFSFAIIADPHMDGNADREAKFQAVLDWLMANGPEKRIEFVFVLGDIAWGGTGGERYLDRAKAMLDALADAGIPYIPLMGDNEVNRGCEEEFDAVFGPHYTRLAAMFDHWTKAPFPNEGLYLENISFDYKGCHFVCPDFNPREAGDEGGNLHDFVGGTWPWFTADIETCAKPKAENILMMTHIGMFNTGSPVSDPYLFSDDEMAQIKTFITPYKNAVAVNYAGHVHENWPWLVPLSEDYLYRVLVTDEPWYDTRWPESNDQEMTIQCVQVRDEGTAFSYMEDRVDVDESVGVEVPNGGESWRAGDVHEIRWAREGTPLPEEVRIGLHDGTRFVDWIVRKTANDGSYRWTIPADLAAGDRYKIRVQSYTLRTTADLSDAPFSITAACLAITAPAPGATVVAGETCAVSWMCGEPAVGPDVRIGLHRGGTFLDWIVRKTANDGEFLWRVPAGLPDAASYRLRLQSYTNPELRTVCLPFRITAAR